MKFVLAFTLVLSSYYCSARQNTDSTSRQNSLSFFFGHSQFKDENIHPKVFRGLTTGALYLHSRTGRNISEYNAGVKLSALNTSYEEFPSAVSIRLVAGYKYLFNLAGGENLGYYLGPAADMQFGTNAYFNWDESHLHFANYISGGIGQRISYATGNRLFTFHADIPLLSYIFRPEYNPQHKIDDMTAGGIFKNLASNPEAVLLFRNFVLETGLEMKYRNRRDKYRAIGCSLRYHYMKARDGARDGKPYQNIDNHISYKFLF